MESWKTQLTACGKDLGEADDIMHDEVKRSMKKEYIRRVKKTLSSKLNAGNVIKAINSWAVSLLRYSGGL
ncbi:unnamed protein product [Porites evermanni]|uniref:Uncharacterized protein n=1 Tax=Porites evermanni TaxID=104178 RepID=A0ABN8MHP5_9CNID|nr:unnamed protein product [Porites evermanni]